MIVNIIFKKAAIAVQLAQSFLIICNRGKNNNIAVSRVANILPSKFVKDQKKANIAKAVDNFFYGQICPHIKRNRRQISINHTV